MKTVIKIVLWLLAIFFGYMIFQSVNGPIEFKKVKQERFQAVINSLKDIRSAQEAHKTVKGVFSPSFESLVKFVDGGQFVLTQQRDSSYMEYDNRLQIDVQRDVKLIDTLGFVSIKDSLFKDSDRYKTMMNVPFAKNNEKFTMKTDEIEKGGFIASVFKVSVKKDVVLYDQPKDLLDREKVLNSVEEINGDEILVGSLDDVSTSGNWPPIYDRKAN
ncbi:hypothetical protein MWU65_06975 [Cellulophaga sp. F20128]|uniref:hypothetical protein n=1 Tax=Cellulophaga sp. F20128 TaxID=2926413 RepID=UPI001FF21AAC|nr:hypothetical protein [Cellulophaga sp. F20128]MCK0156917.1 hypothetical protein [Cellulophaga sp. F20128]